MRAVVQVAVLFAFLTAMSVVVAGVASTLALGRAQVGVLDADLDALISADYSADPDGKRLAPLDAEIGEAVRQDELRLEEDYDFEIVDVFYVDPPENAADEGDPESGTETPGGSPTPSPEADSSPVPGLTPAPGSTPTLGSTPTPTPQPGPSPVPGITPAPQPTPEPKPSPTPQPTPTCTAPDPLSGFVESVTPSDGAIGVSVSTNVVIKFNQPIDGKSLLNNNVLLAGPEGAKVSVTLSYNATTYEATLNPTADLDHGAEYYLSLQWIKNACGTKQGSDVETTFTTAPE